MHRPSAEWLSDARSRAAGGAKRLIDLFRRGWAPLAVWAVVVVLVVAEIRNWTWAESVLGTTHFLRFLHERFLIIALLLVGIIFAFGRLRSKDGVRSWPDLYERALTIVGAYLAIVAAIAFSGALDANGDVLFLGSGTVHNMLFKSGDPDDGFAGLTLGARRRHPEMFYWAVEGKSRYGLQFLVHSYSHGEDKSSGEIPVIAMSSLPAFASASCDQLLPEFEKILGDSELRNDHYLVLRLGDRARVPFEYIPPIGQPIPEGVTVRLGFWSMHRSGESCPTKSESTHVHAVLSIEGAKGEALLPSKVDFYCPTSGAGTLGAILQDRESPRTLGEHQREYCLRSSDSSSVCSDSPDGRPLGCMKWSNASLNRRSIDLSNLTDGTAVIVVGDKLVGSYSGLKRERLDCDSCYVAASMRDFVLVVRLEPATCRRQSGGIGPCRLRLSSDLGDALWNLRNELEQAHRGEWVADWGEAFEDAREPAKEGGGLRGYGIADNAIVIHPPPPTDKQR